MIRRLTLYTLATCLFGATLALARPPVWTVRDADSEMVLFVSIHMLPPASPRCGPQGRRRSLAGDSDRSRDRGLCCCSCRAAGPPAGASNLGRIAALRWPRAPAQGGVEETYGLSSAALQTLRPWMVEVVLSGAQTAKQGANAAGGVEQTLTADLDRTARLMALETLDQQTELFAGAVTRVQIASLEQALRKLVEDARGYDRLVTAWMAGDLKALRTLAVEIRCAASRSPSTSAI